MDNENIINAELENANLGETYESLEDGNVSVDKEDEESRFMSSAKTYQKLSDKYEDLLKRINDTKKYLSGTKKR